MSSQPNQQNEAMMLIQELEAPSSSKEILFVDESEKPQRLGLQQMEQMEKQILQQQNELRERQERRRQKQDDLKQLTVVEPWQISAKVREITEKTLANMNRLDVQDVHDASEACG